MSDQTEEIRERMYKTAGLGIVSDPYSAARELVDLRFEVVDLRKKLEAAKAREEAAATLQASVLTVMERRGWSRHWTHRSAYLHLEAAELAEAIRGKRGDTLEESADVLMTLLAFSPHDLPEIIEKATEQVADLMTAPVYAGEERLAASEPPGAE